ncbi:hypothetical protein PRIPAC_93804 [Pristionchus pacificus]|uniref:PDZ domain-containing protein n=1 Tax=Pristionchus pacificus TaxID=54126 RepID=A0A2A6CDN7_PRIPA|nr:hypothetical protein PRIPAC_93804 [Pristionchus pacificus]|eukprot:PDM76236.1 PDZ domain-containing protein [Pristionchus pacificus]
MFLPAGSCLDIRIKSVHLTTYRSSRMDDRTFTVSSDEESSFEDIDGLSMNGLQASDEPGKEKVADLAGAKELANVAEGAALEEDMVVKLREKVDSLLTMVLKGEVEMKQVEDEHWATLKSKDDEIDQLKQFNRLLMKENEDLKAKPRTRTVDEGTVSKADGVTDDHRAKFKEQLNNASGIMFAFTLLHMLCSYYAFYEGTWFNIPAIVLFYHLAIFPINLAIYSTRNVVVRLMILISDVVWLFSVEPKFYFILMVIKSILIVRSAWSMSDDMSTRYKEIKDRLTSACCPAKFAGAEALRDGTPRIVEIEKTGYSLGFTISKNSDSPVYVAHILHDGAAEKGGLKAGDEILKVNGTAVDGKTKEEVASMLKFIEGTVKLEVRNNNKELVANEI